MRTTLVRFLILLSKASQHITQKVYAFVPDQDFCVALTDEKLNQKYGITDEEISFMEKLIKPMD
jgi:site-specific DNA-methyltransferase (adenine-specific)